MAKNIFVTPKPSSYYTRTGIGMFNKSKNKKNRKYKSRNPIAVAHSMRGAAGCGSHKDKKREANRKACRGRIRTDI